MSFIFGISCRKYNYSVSFFLAALFDFRQKPRFCDGYNCWVELALAEFQSFHLALFFHLAVIDDPLQEDS